MAGDPLQRVSPERLVRGPAAGRGKHHEQEEHRPHEEDPGAALPDGVRGGRGGERRPREAEVEEAVGHEDPDGEHQLDDRHGQEGRERPRRRRPRPRRARRREADLRPRGEERGTSDEGRREEERGLELEVEGTRRAAEATGDGPVDATFRAICAICPHQANLALFQIHAVTGGTDAQAEVTVRLEENGKTVNGQAADTDTPGSVAKANAAHTPVVCP